MITVGALMPKNRWAGILANLMAAVTLAICRDVKERCILKPNLDVSTTFAPKLMRRKQNKVEFGHDHCVQSKDMEVAQINVHCPVALHHALLILRLA